jgi:hypothetical protein
MSIQPGVTFRAWRIAENDRHEADPIAMAVKNLPDAIGVALRHCAHKDAFVVETHDQINAKRTLHFFRVRQKARTWRFNYETNQSEVFKPDLCRRAVQHGGQRLRAGRAVALGSRCRRRRP